MLDVVVDEGDEISAPEISAPAKAYTLCRSPHIRMDEIELVTAPVSFGEEWKLVLLPELAGFTYLGLPATKLRQTENNLFRLQVLKPPVINVANPLVPEINIGFDLLSFGEQRGADVIGVEDEHPPVSAPLRNDLALFLNEAPEVRESHLHPLVDDLTNRHQVLRDCRNV